MPKLKRRNSWSVVGEIALPSILMVLFLGALFLIKEDIGLGDLILVYVFVFVGNYIVMNGSLILRFITGPLPDSFLVFLIFFGGSVMLILAGILSYEVCKEIVKWWGIWGDFPDDFHESMRNLIFTFTGIGAAIGLYFAAKRQKTFSDQMQVQADQSFNERLGRGVELLAKDDVIMRSAGVRILVDLANNASEAQKPIVGNIIYDFFRDKVRIKYYKNGKRRLRSKKEGYEDLQNALDFLVNIPIDERENVYQNWLYIGKLDFRNSDFSDLSFVGKNLKNIDFSDCYIFDATFENATIENIFMRESEINGTSFCKAKIFDSDFFRADIEDSNFRFAKIEKTSFLFVKIVEVEFLRTEFLSGYFYADGKIKISKEGDLPHFMFAEIGYSKFEFDSKFKLKNFSESCYYPIEDWASAKHIPMKRSRGYKYDSTKVQDIFVQSKEYWSKQPVRPWVTVEMAQWKLEQLEQIESLPDWKRDEDDIAEAKDKLKIAISILRDYQKEYGLPQKTPKPNPKPKPTPPNKGAKP